MPSASAYRAPDDDYERQPNSKTPPRKSSAAGSNPNTSWQPRRHHAAPPQSEKQQFVVQWATRSHTEKKTPIHPPIHHTTTKNKSVLQNTAGCCVNHAENSVRQRILATVDSSTALFMYGALPLKKIILRMNQRFSIESKMYLVPAVGPTWTTPNTIR